MVRILSLTLLLTLAACSVHLGPAKRRAKKMIKTAERLDPALFSDTVFITKIDTFWREVPPVTFEKTLIKHDTVYLYDTITDVRLQYFYDTLTNTITVKADCPDCPEITIENTGTVPLVVGDSLWKNVRDRAEGFFLAFILGSFIFAWFHYKRRRHARKSGEQDQA